MDYVPNEEKYFVVYGSSFFAFRVFCRMRQSLAKRGWTLVLVTHALSLWWKARRMGIHCHLVRFGCPNSSYLGLSTTKTMEYMKGFANRETLIRFQASIARTMEKLLLVKPPSAIGIWNGLDASGQIMTAFARQNQIPTIYFELGNIDSKLFADPEGVNATSWVARSPGILDEWTISDNEFSAWLKRFKSQRLNTVAPPQARLIRTINLWYPIDRLGMFALRIPQPYITPLIKKIKSKLQIRRIPVAPETKPDWPYVFLPLQVASDSNLLLLANCDNLTAIDFAEKRARDLGCGLVVKIHPAETNASLISKIIHVCAERGHLLTSFNTTELILGATEVVTINSTAGLEALLHGKKVKILGRSLYDAFSADQAKAYALRHLVDFDPFGTAPMTSGALDQVLGILRMYKRSEQNHLKSERFHGEAPYGIQESSKSQEAILRSS